MSTTFVEFGGATSARPSSSQWMKRVRLPLAAWSRRRRWVVAVMIAAVVFGLGAHGWVVADLGGVEASRTALEAATQHLADARRALAQLPALRRQAAATPGAQLPASWTSADDVRIVSELAAQNSVSLLSVEPGAARGSDAESMRPIQLTAHTDFVHLMAFLRGLSDLPVLIVPVDVTVNRDAASLAVRATLHVFSALRPVPSTATADAFADDSLDSDDEEDIVFFDPFSLPQMLASGEPQPDASQLRLVGLLHDRARGLALLETPDGATIVVSGQQLGTERVTRLDALSITLANGGATRTLALTEAS
ncbi:type 4a pilus biogenesis protein PilO [Paraburkholderia sp.]|uniref:type 4a pilus biogenesis protein PilO n=1 Tax=Paraburkholderia sp. TaxID=1926495 RepID=UPI002D269770|nr:type 4a pilus biogenesis protein PilO [Paraburkholderia sp.]HZZ02265.1 type 4a pilus biogenesis protein PilO [Paraburkholderia sp.]